MLTVWLVRLPPQQARHSAADARQAPFRDNWPSIAPYVPLGLTHRQAPVCARVASQALTPHLKRQPVSNALLLIFPTSQWPQCAGAVLQAHTARWRERQFAWTAWRARTQELTPVPASPVLLAVIPHQRPVCVLGASACLCADGSYAEDASAACVPCAAGTYFQKFAINISVPTTTYVSNDVRGIYHPWRRCMERLPNQSYAYCFLWHIKN